MVTVLVGTLWTDLVPILVLHRRDEAASAGIARSGRRAAAAWSIVFMMKFLEGRNENEKLC